MLLRKALKAGARRTQPNDRPGPLDPRPIPQFRYASDSGFFTFFADGGMPYARATLMSSAGSTLPSGFFSGRYQRGAAAAANDRYLWLGGSPFPATRGDPLTQAAPTANFGITVGDVKYGVIGGSFAGAAGGAIFLPAGFRRSAPSAGGAGISIRMAGRGGNTTLDVAAVMAADVASHQFVSIAANVYGVSDGGGAYACWVYDYTVNALTILEDTLTPNAEMPANKGLQPEQMTSYSDIQRRRIRYAGASIRRIDIIAASGGSAVVLHRLFEHAEQCDEILLDYGSISTYSSDSSGLSVSAYTTPDHATPQYVQPYTKQESGPYAGASFLTPGRFDVMAGDVLIGMSGNVDIVSGGAVIARAALPSGATIIALAWMPFDQVPLVMLRSGNATAAYVFSAGGLVAIKPAPFPAYTAWGAYDSTNKGGATIESITISASATPGIWLVTGTADGAFSVRSPSGSAAGTGSVGVPFSASGIAFVVSGTIVAGDKYLIKALPETTTSPPMCGAIPDAGNTGSATMRTWSMGGGDLPTYAMGGSNTSTSSISGQRRYVVKANGACDEYMLFGSSWMLWNTYTSAVDLRTQGVEIVGAAVPGDAWTVYDIPACPNGLLPASQSSPIDMTVARIL